MKIERDKKTVDDAADCLNHNIDLQSSLRQRTEELEKMEKSFQKVVAQAESRAKEMQYTKDALLACMKEAKVLIDSAFAKGRVDQSDALPEADPIAFSDWLSTKMVSSSGCFLVCLILGLTELRLVVPVHSRP